MKTLMVVPFVSKRTFPLYVKKIIESYSFQPEYIDYVPNNRQLRHIDNQPDMKVIKSFRVYEPDDYLIIHNSDVYLNPVDLDEMIHVLGMNKKAFAIGVYPITSLKHSTLSDIPVIPTRVAVWKAAIFKKTIDVIDKMITKSPDRLVDDAQYYQGEEAQRLGYKCLVSGNARVFHVNLEVDYRTLIV